MTVTGAIARLLDSSDCSLVQLVKNMQKSDKQDKYSCMISYFKKALQRKNKKLRVILLSLLTELLLTVVLIDSVRLERIPLLKEIKLKGIAILGDIWEQSNYQQYFEQLKAAIAAL